jgi:putative flippase GtrA
MADQTGGGGKGDAALGGHLVRRRRTGRHGHERDGAVGGGAQGGLVLVAEARFVLCGGVGLASSFAVAATAAWMPWALANAVITVVSTVLATELHARFTFGAGGHATWRQHTQSAGSAAAAYAVTCVAMFALQLLVAAPTAVLEQTVYLSASALAGVARFVVLRVVVFTRSRTQAAVPAPSPALADAAYAGRPVPVAHASAPASPTALCPAA